MKQKIINLVNECYDKKRGGVSIIQLITNHNLKGSDLMPLITEMYNNGEIEIKEGVNGYLLFKTGIKKEIKIKKRRK